jgi:hypothetical protein
MTSPRHAPDDRSAPPPVPCHWRSIALDVVQAVTVALAVVIGLAWFARRTDEHHREVSDQIGRIEQGLKDHRRYILARDSAWAESIGLPLPPEAEAPRP